MFKGDIDIDVADRSVVLSLFDHAIASVLKSDGSLQKHASGVYFTDIPVDHNNICTIDYKTAEERGYQKVDVLNMSVYTHVTSPDHLKTLMQPPDWSLLLDREFCQKLVHIGNHYDTMMTMPEPIDSIEKMAMFLAIIRPGKRHLIGKSWRDVEASVWGKNEDGGYSFKKSHSTSYAMLVAVHINILANSSTT